MEIYFICQRVNTQKYSFLLTYPDLKMREYVGVQLWALIPLYISF